jgi:hypothetical protein
MSLTAELDGRPADEDIRGWDYLLRRSVHRMPIDVTCPVCSQSFRLRDDMAGRTVRCRCGRPLTVPNPAANVGPSPSSALTGLLHQELSRQFQQAPPAEAEAPASHAPQTLRGAVTFAPPPADGWSVRLAIALRCILGIMGLVYGLLMLGIGSRAVWQFGFEVYLVGILKATWLNVIYLMIAASGLLLAVACVDVMLSRRAGEVKARFASGALVALWGVAAFLVATSFLHEAAEKDASLFSAALWKLIGEAVFRRLPWMIAPALIFGWCLVMVKRSSKDS